MRAFIAIELPVEIKNALSAIQEKLKIELLKLLSSEILALRARTLTLRTGLDNDRESINWVKPQNLHLTLKFLGDISPEQLNGIKEIIIEITKTVAGFKIKLEAAGVFPNLNTARIIWVGADQPPPELKQLVQQLETRIAETEIPWEQRDFRAHITIGRIKNRLNPSDLKNTLDNLEKNVTGANWEFDCRKITLFESSLGPGGPTYTALDQFNLKIT